MLTSHRFSCSLGTISLHFEDEALIGLDLEGSAGCGERLMAQLARHGIDPAAFRPEATPAALAVEQAQNAVTQPHYAHDMQIYQLENTELLSSGTTGKTSA